MTLDMKDEKPIQTISLNLNDYASTSAKQSQNQAPRLEPPLSTPPIRTSSLASPTPELRIAIGDTEPGKEEQTASSRAADQDEAGQTFDE